MLSPNRLLCLVLIPLVLAGCGEEQHQQQLKMLKDEIDVLTEHHMKAKSELVKLRSQVESLLGERKKSMEEKAEVEADLEAVKKAFEELQKKFDAYRAQYRLSMKTRAGGTDLGTLVVDEKTYLNVKVREVTDDLLVVMHDTGPAKFAWNIVPETVRKLFGLEHPGEHVVARPFERQLAKATLSIEDQIIKHDAQMLALQKEINQLAADEDALQLRVRATRKEIIRREKDGRDNTEQLQQRSLQNAEQVRLDVRIKQLRKQQDDLNRLDPRRRKV